MGRAGCVSFYFSHPCCTVSRELRSTMFFFFFFLGGGVAWHGILLVLFLLRQHSVTHCLGSVSNVSFFSSICYSLVYIPVPPLVDVGLRIGVDVNSSTGAWRLFPPLGLKAAGVSRN